MIDLRNVSFPAILAGGGFGTAAVVFGSTLITHPVAGGCFLGLAAVCVAKVQQHSADRRARKATRAATDAQASAEQQGAERVTRIRSALPPANGHSVTYGAVTDHVTHREV